MSAQNPAVRTVSVCLEGSLAYCALGMKQPGARARVQEVELRGLGDWVLRPSGHFR